MVTQTALVSSAIALLLTVGYYEKSEHDPPVKPDENVDLPAEKTLPLWPLLEQPTKDSLERSKHPNWPSAPASGLLDRGDG